jgi:hypothetical protein
MAQAQLSAPAAAVPALRFLVTDGEERFVRIGPVFLERQIALQEVERVDLEADARRPTVTNNPPSAPSAMIQPS